MTERTHPGSYLEGARRTSSDRMKRLWTRGATAAAVVAASVAICAGTVSAAGSKPSGASRSKSPVVVGVVIDMTGPASSSGVAVKTGLNYFVKKTNSSGGVDGHPIKLEYCNTQSTATGGATCAKSLSSVSSHIVLLAGALPSTEGAVPQLSGVIGLAGLPVLFPKKGTDVFQVLAGEQVTVAPLITEAKRAHVKTMGVLYTSNASGTAQLHAIETGASNAGIKVVSEPMTTGATDVTTQLLQLKSSGAQVIVLASIGLATLVSLTSYHTLGMKLPVVVGAEAATNAFLKALPFPVPPHLYAISSIPVAKEGLTKKEISDWRTYGKGRGAPDAGGLSSRHRAPPGASRHRP